MRRPAAPDWHPPLTVAAIAVRPRARDLMRAAFPRRRARLLLVKTQREFERCFHNDVIDAAVVDLGAPSDETPAVIDAAREYPCTPFFGLSALRSADASIVARCISSDFCDVWVEGVDDASIREQLQPKSFTWRFAQALHVPPPELGLDAGLRTDVWHAIIAHGGRPLQTEAVAELLGVTREHLSRAFSAVGAPNLKRVIDLVRLIAAAELSKCPGYDVGDVANVLGFASSSHLSTTSLRIVGTRPTSLARLRAVDLVERFAKGRTRSQRPDVRKGRH